MNERLTRKLKGDRYGLIALVSSLIALLLFFVYFYLDRGEFVGGIYSPIDFEIFGRALEQFSSGDTEDVLAVLIALPLYLLRGLALIAIGIAPPLMLALSVVSNEPKRRKTFVVAALIVSVAGCPISRVLEGFFEGFYSLHLLPFELGIQILALVAFLVCIFALPEKKYAVLIACAALCCVALAMTLATIPPPFGSDYGAYGFKTFSISVLFSYAFFWVAVAFSIMSADRSDGDGAPGDKKPLPLHSRGDMSAKDTPVLSMPEVSDVIKELKVLMDAGALTQEEFDSKKKELLGL